MPLCHIVLIISFFTISTRQIGRLFFYFLRLQQYQSLTVEKQSFRRPKVGNKNHFRSPRCNCTVINSDILGQISCDAVLTSCQSLFAMFQIKKQKGGLIKHKASTYAAKFCQLAPAQKTAQFSQTNASADIILNIYVCVGWAVLKTMSGKVLNTFYIKRYFHIGSCKTDPVIYF